MIRARLALTAFALLLTAPAPLLAQDGERYAYVRLDTTLGELILELDRENAPLTTRNFLAYVGDGFYDGLAFHRVIGDLMAQAGGYEADLTRREVTRPPIRNESDNGLKNIIGSLAMAHNVDPHSATTQFFINLADNTAFDYADDDKFGYTVFGKVIEGMDALIAIKRARVELDERVDPFTPAAPVTPIVINVAVEVPATACADSIALARAAERDAAGLSRSMVAAVDTARETEADEVFALVKALGLDVDDLSYSTIGLGSIVMQEGAGPQPKKTDKVIVHYTGYLLDGQVFDSSRERSAPSEFVLNRVIAGWTAGVGMMKPGERRLLVLPPSLAYGRNGIPGTIPPDSTLVFDVELIDIVDFTSMESGKSRFEKLSRLPARDGVTTASGLFYVDEVVGEGRMPTELDKVMVHYTGWLVDGQQFDGSREGRDGLPGSPLSFRVTGVIKGWTEALMSMHEGGKRWVVIPGDLAYGQLGRLPKIPKNAVLIFEMELLGFGG